MVQSRPDDPQKHIRQLTYIRALETIPSLSVHYGTFLSHPVTLPLASPPTVGSKFARVIRTAEKGSDVNLAAHLLADAFTGDCDVVAVVSNDSDLVEPLKIVRDRLGLKVGILNPHPQNRSRELGAVATFYKPIRSGVLASSQFPETPHDERGGIVKPASW